MMDLSTLKKLDECADSIQELECEIIRIQDKIRSTFNTEYYPSYFIEEANDLNDIINDYICASEKTHESIDRFVKSMRYILDSYSALSPSLFDFIANFDVNAWWQQAYPIIEQIATVTGALTGVAAIATAPHAFIKWIRSKLQEKKTNTEYVWVKLILDQDEWTVSALSEKIELSEDEAKKMLRGFGYKWSPQKMLYVSTENTQKLRDVNIQKTNI